MKRRLTRLVVLGTTAVLLFLAGFLILSPARAHRPPTATLGSLRGNDSKFGWLRDLSRRVLTFLRKPELVRFRADVLTAPELTGIGLGRLLGRAPRAEYEGTQLWFISTTNEIEKIEQHLVSLGSVEEIAQPIIVASEFGTASMFVGTSAMAGA